MKRHQGESTKDIARALNKMGIKISKKETGLLQRYEDEVERWARTHSIVSRSQITKTKEQILDSLSALKTGCFESVNKYLDVGSGAGFPAIPIKIIKRELDATLVEPAKKKAVFLRNVIRVLGLDRVEVLPVRIETLGKKRREEYEIITSKALSSLNVLCEYAFPLLKVGGRLIAYKGKKYSEEVKETGRALEVLGGVIESVMEINLQGKEGKRYIIVIKKIENTPLTFPRRDGIAKKRPLI